MTESDAFFSAWAPPPRLTVSEWAARHRFLSPESSAVPGAWENDRAPYLVAPMDALSPYHPAETVVCKFSSQTGKTEIALNFLGFIIDCDPGPILVIQPNVTPMGEAFSKDRLTPMLRDAPTLAKKIGGIRGRTSASTITHKSFPGGQVSIAGANSPAGLASRPIRYLICDELDRWDTTREGDPLALARKRQQTYRSNRRSKTLVVSSPTYDDVGISAEYAKCSQRFEWHLTCQHCGRTQFPALRHFAWDDGAPRSVRYACEHCGAEHPLEQADAVKLSGAWVCVADGEPDSVGFWMNQWGSMFARWDDTIAEWLRAQGDSAERQAVVNTAFAEGWSGEGERADPKSLATRGEVYPAEVPGGAVMITIGADVQGDRIEAEVVGWGERMESWSIAYEVLPGEPTSQQVWEDLLDLFRTQWTHETGATLSATAMVVDSGAYTQHVYEWVARTRDARIIPGKGVGGMGRDHIDRDENARRKRSARRMRYGKPPELLGVDAIKRSIYHHLSALPGAAGYCHFPVGRSEEYYAQLAGERLVLITPRGRRPEHRWVPVHAAVEALDCRVYAYAALLLSGMNAAEMRARLGNPGAPRAPRRFTRPSAGGFARDGWAL